LLLAILNEGVEPLAGGHHRLVYRKRVAEGSLECLGIPGGRHLSQP